MSDNTKVFHLLVDRDGEASITVYVPSVSIEPWAARSDHPNFKAIVAKATADDVSVLDLFDISVTVAKRFENITDRVAVANGQVYLDGDVLNNTLADHIIRALDEGVEDFVPLALFYEKLLSNPNPHSIDQLYRWLDSEKFSLAADGDIIGYKAVARNGNGGYFSLHSGPAIVNGEEHLIGQVRQNVGDVVEMPRSQVTFDPAVGCHVGLHVGTDSYARTFGGDVVLEVHVNPRDVVSVPTESGDTKMRVCRYVVVGEAESKYQSAVVSNSTTTGYSYDDDEYGDECLDCGEYLDDCLCEEEDPFAKDDDEFTVSDLCSCGNPDCSWSN